MIPDPTPSTKTPSLDWRDPWSWGLLSCFLLLVLLATRLISEPDLGFHLRGGQWMLQNLRFFANDVYTYTLSDHPYLDIHWLYQILLYAAYRAGGYPFLSILNILLLTLVFLTVSLRLRLTGAPLYIRVLLLAAALLACEPRFKLRPEDLSWLFMSLTLLVLELRENRGRDLIFLLPPIHLVWANTEGLFGIGWALMAIFFLSHTFHQRKTDLKLLKVGALSVAACFLNPNFIRGAIYPFTNLALLGASNAFHEAVGELLPPFSLTTGLNRLFLPQVPLFTYKFYSLFLFLLLAATFRRRKLHEFLLSLSFFYLSVTAYRNISLLMLATLPVAAACWKDLSWKWLLRLQGSVFTRPAAAIVFTLCILLFGLRVVTNAYYLSDRRSERFGLGLNLDRLPVQATEFLKANHLDGRILNQDMCGGWLDWQGPQKVFVDGRWEVMGEPFYDEYRTTSSGGLDQLAQKYEAQILFFSPSDCNWAVELGKTRRWRLVYLDDLIAVYLKQGYAPQMPALDNGRSLEQWGVPTASANAGALEETPPNPFQVWAEGFYRHQTYPVGLYNAADFYLQTGDPQTAEVLLLQALRETNGRYWEFYLRLAQSSHAAGQYDREQLCFERLLETSPGFITEHLRKKSPG